MNIKGPPHPIPSTDLYSSIKRVLKAFDCWPSITAVCNCKWTLIGCLSSPKTSLLRAVYRFSSKKSAAIESGIRGSKAHQPRSNLYIGTNQPWNLQTGLYQGESMFELTDPLYRPRSCRSSWFFLFFDFPYFSIRCIFQSVVYYICI